MTLIFDFDFSEAVSMVLLSGYRASHHFIIKPFYQAIWNASNFSYPNFPLEIFFRRFRLVGCKGGAMKQFSMIFSCLFIWLAGFAESYGESLEPFDPAGRQAEELRTVYYSAATGKTPQDLVPHRSLEGTSSAIREKKN